MRSDVRVECAVPPGRRATDRPRSPCPGRDGSEVEGFTMPRFSPTTLGRYAAGAVRSFRRGGPRGLWAYLWDWYARRKWPGLPGLRSHSLHVTLREPLPATLTA